MTISLVDSAVALQLDFMVRGTLMGLLELEEVGEALTRNPISHQDGHPRWARMAPIGNIAHRMSLMRMWSLIGLRG
jgi:hypothetical protein